MLPCQPLINALQFAMQCLPKKVYLFITLQFVFLTFEVLATITVLDKGVTPLERNSVGIQFYIDVENKDRLSTCKVSSWTKNCCLTDEEEDCDTMQVYGAHYTLRPKDRETLVHIYPLLFQHDQVGYCDFILDYQCGRSRPSKRQIVNVSFNSKITRDMKLSNVFLSHYIGNKKKTVCGSTDQNSLNDCKPVNCDFKYNGERPFYDYDNGKCVEATICDSDPDNELPEIVYVPSINTCRDLEHPLTIADIYAISTGNGVVTEASKKEEMKVEVKSNCSTISQNLKFLCDLMDGNLCPVLNTDTSDYSNCSKSAFLSIVGYIICICLFLLSFICCIQTLVWLHMKIENQELKNIWSDITSKFKKGKGRRNYREVVNTDVRNTLLREVIVKDIPMELRDSMVNICERMDRQVRRKKRYRRADVGSQISLSKAEYGVRASTATTSTSSIDNCDEQEKLLKN